MCKVCNKVKALLSDGHFVEDNMLIIPSSVITRSGNEVMFTEKALFGDRILAQERKDARNH